MKTKIAPRARMAVALGLAGLLTAAGIAWKRKRAGGGQS